MATFTYVVTATKVDLTAGTGTLEDLFDDLAISDPGVLTRTGTDPYVYTFAAPGPELEISAGVVLNCTNDGDTLRWDTAAGRTIIDVTGSTSTYGTLNVGPNFTIDGQVTPTGLAIYITCYGVTNFLGTAGNEITIKNIRQCSIYPRAYVSANNWDYVTMSHCQITGGALLYMLGTNQYFNNNPQSFTNIKLDGLTDNKQGQLQINYGQFTNWTFDNWEVDGLASPLMYNSTFKFSNSTFKNIVSSYPRVYSGGASINAVEHYTTARTLSDVFQTGDPWNQPKVTFENCTFDNNYTLSGTTYCFYGCAQGSLILFDGCTFQNADRGVYAFYGGMALWSGTTTFTSVPLERQWNAGTHLHAFKLDLTVQDSGGSPVENAVVQVRQKEGKESWQMVTDSSGQVLDVHGDAPVFVYQEETATGVYDIWSDGTGDQVHVIEAYKANVGSYRNEVSFDQDRTMVVELNQTATNIYNSTIYDSTIY